MAFTQTNAQRELTSRKILEELQLKKQLLLKQGAATNLNSTPPTILPIVSNPPGSIAFSTAPASTLIGESHTTSTQRAALHSAHSQSFGSFITQDSSFGNLILPIQHNVRFAMFPCMKLRLIEEFLQEIEVFDKPKVTLEQYPTPSHLASHMLHTIQALYDDIDSKLVADLGCGCGSLTLGAAVLNAGLAVGFEIDADALEIFCSNVETQELENVEIVQCDVLNISDRWDKIFDTVVMNPPFGTKSNPGIDMKFLKRAFKLSNNVVYSLHKTSTRAHVLKTAAECGATGKVLAELRYDLPATQKFHKQKSVDIMVDFFRFEVGQL